MATTESDNFGFSTRRTVDGITVIELYVDVEVPKTAEEARAAAQALVAASRPPSKIESFEVAPVNPWPGAT